MVISDRQKNLESRFLIPLSIKPTSGMTYSKLFGPMEDWMMTLGGYTLFLSPMNRRWYFSDTWHDTFNDLGCGAFEVIFYLENDELRMEPTTAKIPSVSTEGGRTSLTAGDGRSFALQAHTTLGSEPRCDIVIKGAAAPLHALIVQHRTGFSLLDAGATSGSYINGQKVRGVADIGDSDVIVTGGETFLVSLDLAAQPSHGATLAPIVPLSVLACNEVAAPVLWYYAMADQTLGPVNENQLRERLARNDLPGDTLVWNPELPDWRTATLAGLVASPPATPVPPPLPAFTSEVNATHEIPVCQGDTTATATSSAPTQVHAASCAHCGSLLAEDAKFCEQCGTPVAVPPAPTLVSPVPLPSSLVLKCSRCHQPLEPGTKYCSGCGSPVAAPAAAPLPTPTCPRCAAPIKQGVRFCTGCGALLA